MSFRWTSIYFLTFDFGFVGLFVLVHVCLRSFTIVCILIFFFTFMQYVKDAHRVAKFQETGMQVSHGAILHYYYFFYLPLDFSLIYVKNICIANAYPYNPDGNWYRIWFIIFVITKYPKFIIIIIISKAFQVYFHVSEICNLRYVM